MKAFPGCHARFAHGERDTARLAVWGSTCPEFHTRLRQAKIADCHLAWVVGALPLRELDDNAWLRECRKTGTDPLCGPPPIPFAHVDRRAGSAGFGRHCPCVLRHEDGVREEM